VERVLADERLRIVLAAAGLLGLVAAVILLNLALLGYAQPRNDPVGKLSPRAVLTRGPASPPQVVTVAGGEHDD
jgi:hypothetical protein